MTGPPRRPMRFSGRYHFGGMDWHDLVRLIGARHGRPDLSEEEITWILWEHTAFPLVTGARVCVQLHRFFTAQERDA